MRTTRSEVINAVSVSGDKTVIIISIDYVSRLGGGKRRGEEERGRERRKQEEKGGGKEEIG